MFNFTLSSYYNQTTKIFYLFKKLKSTSSEIMVEDVLSLFNDSVKDEECVLGIGFCNNECKCALHDQWVEPKLLMQKMFRESSLKDIAGKGCKI